MRVQGTMSFVLYDESMQYMLVHRCPGADSTPLFWGPDRANGQASGKAIGSHFLRGRIKCV